MHFIEGLVHRKLDLLVILMSAYASVETVVAATRLGAYDFLAKPFTPEEIRASIRKASKHLLLRRHARKLAEQGRAARFQAMSVLAHELKSPLASIDGYLRILKDGWVVKDEATTQRIIDRSLTRLDGMRKLIIDLLDLTRLESGEKRREKIDVNLCDLTKAAFETTDAPGKGAEYFSSPGVRSGSGHHSGGSRRDGNSDEQSDFECGEIQSGRRFSDG